MTRHGLWTHHLCALLLAVALSPLAACGGDPPSTLPPDPVEKRDAGQELPDAGTPDTGVVPDGSVVTKAIKSLNVVGDPTPEVNYEGKIALQAILIDSQIGAITGETVSFNVVSGSGTLTTNNAVTDAAGIARVEFTAGTTTGMVHVIALAPGVEDEDRADWAINVVEPVRTLELVGQLNVQVIDGQRVPIAAKLTQRGRPVVGAKVTFSASPAGLLLDGTAVASKVATTNLQGVATVELGAQNVAVERTVSVSAIADYAAPLFYSVQLLPKPPCDEPGGECAASQLCVDGECIARPECSDDLEIYCNTGYSCVNERCVADTAPGCTDSSECAAGYYCDSDRERCLRGCDDDDRCVAPKICDLDTNTCVNPTTETCQVDEDCATNYVCAGGECIPDFSQGDTCSDSDECPWGQYCNPVAQHCVPGCDSDDRCDSGLCDLNAHVCVVKECEYDEDCASGLVCDETYHCVEAPPVVLNVEGDWAMVQVFHVQNMLPSSVQSALTKIDSAFGIANAILQGRGGDLLPDWVPSFIKDPIGAAIANAISDYVPEWAVDVVHIGSDVTRALKDFEIRSTLTIEQPRTADNPNHDPALLSGVDRWETAVFYWYTADCPAASAGQTPPECALVEIDLTDGAFRVHQTAFEGRVSGVTLTVDTHNISFQYGKAVRMLLETLIQSLTGYDSILEAIQGFVDCEAVNSWIQDTVSNLLGDFELFGLSADDIVNSINLTSQCNSSLVQAAGLITTSIDQLSAETPIAMSGSATISRDNGNVSPIGDHLVRGVWNGTFNGNAPANGQPLADWNAER